MQIFRNKIIIFLFIVLSFNLGSTAFAVANDYDNVGICSASLNASTGKLIAGQNQNLVMPLASLTKLMTALVLLDLGINFNRKVVITKSEVNYTLPFIGKGDITSKIDLQIGDKVTKNDLWHAMLIASSNEAAIALVDNSGISRASFVKRMNSKARAYGLTHTKFFEPTGISPMNIGTAKEMAVIARRAYRSLTIRTASIKPEYKFIELKTGRKIYVVSRNNSLLAMKPLGMKVGYLTESKNNCAVRLNKSGKDRVVVILHAANTARRNAEINRLMKK